jgi:amidase
LLEIGFDTALARAQELDDYFKTNSKLIGPLHGLPVTLKDQFHIKGLETSMGFVGWIGNFEGKKGTGKEKKVESEVVQELWSLGAIPIGKVRRSRARALIQSVDGSL